MLRVHCLYRQGGSREGIVVASNGERKTHPLADQHNTNTHRGFGQVFSLKDSFGDMTPGGPPHLDAGTSMSKEAQWRATRCS
eukprot:3057710-Rhodomonas_salina.2